MACLFVTAANPGLGQSAAPVTAPANTSVPASAAGLRPPPPLTDAQKAVLTGKLADFVSQFATDTGIRLVPIPAGTFMMGSPADEVGRLQDEGPQTRVTLTKDFFLGATTVTQGQWNAVMGRNPSTEHGDPLPVEDVDWANAKTFCERLTDRERSYGNFPAGYAFTLPTEAQWEYACRAGTTSPYPGDLEAMVWYKGNSVPNVHPAGSKKPNAWGLFDMNGNIDQWCIDYYGPYQGGAVADPSGPTTGTKHVIRGANCWQVAQACRSAYRGAIYELVYDGARGSVNGIANLGFRLAFAPSLAK